MDIVLNVKGRQAVHLVPVLEGEEVGDTKWHLEVISVIQKAALIVLSPAAVTSCYGAPENSYVQIPASTSLRQLDRIRNIAEDILGRWISFRSHSKSTE